MTSATHSVLASRSPLSCSSNSPREEQFYRLGCPVEVLIVLLSGVSKNMSSCCGSLGRKEEKKSRSDTTHTGVHILIDKLDPLDIDIDRLSPFRRGHHLKNLVN